MRIGHGYDVHKLISGRKLILGGVDIPYDKGLLGHSDADVLLHAISDALLGAAALGDIGKHFPPDDERFRDADSLLLLAHVGKLVKESGYTVSNIDSTVLAQRPKLAPHIEKMRENIARALELDVSAVSVKATTEEGLGFTGAGEGIAAQAVCLLDSVGDYLRGGGGVEVYAFDEAGNQIKGTGEGYYDGVKLADTSYARNNKTFGRRFRGLL